MKKSRETLSQLHHNFASILDVAADSKTESQCEVMIKHALDYIQKAALARRCTLDDLGFTQDLIDRGVYNTRANWHCMRELEAERASLLHAKK
jgi:hypothetical protein